MVAVQKVSCSRNEMEIPDFHDKSIVVLLQMDVQQWDNNELKERKCSKKEDPCIPCRFECTTMRM
jgi:hypothetical protein